MSQKFDKNWPLIPILGYEDSPLNNYISSLSSRNQSAFNLYQAGLRMVGQLFIVNSRREVGVLHQLHLVLTGLGVINPRNMYLLNLYVPMFLQSNLKNDKNFGKTENYCLTS